MPALATMLLSTADFKPFFENSSMAAASIRARLAVLRLKKVDFGIVFPLVTNRSYSTLSYIMCQESTQIGLKLDLNWNNLQIIFTKANKNTIK